MNPETIDHLLEIRKKLIYIMAGFCIAFLCLFHFANSIYNYIATPLLAYFPKDTKLIATDILSPFLVPLKLTAICAFVISLPNSIYQVWQFIAPGLYRNEKKVLLCIICSAIVLFLGGVLFCYFIMLPVFFSFINHIKAPDIYMFTDISKYLDFIFTLFTVFGLCFEVPIIVVLLIYFKLVSYAQIKSLRPYIFVGCFIVAAIAAPPDVLSQTLLAVPLYLLYETGLIIGKVLSR